jgi:hypothetical protein
MFTLTKRINPPATPHTDKKANLRLRTGIRAGDDQDCTPCGNCMYMCAAEGKEDCTKKCAEKCGY